MKQLRLMAGVAAFSLLLLLTLKLLILVAPSAKIFASAYGKNIFHVGWLVAAAWFAYDAFSRALEKYRWAKAEGRGYVWEPTREVLAFFTNMLAVLVGAFAPLWLLARIF